MKLQNLHRLEGITRIVVGIMIGSWALYAGVLVFLPIAAIMMVTGALRYCPLYHVLKFDTL